MCKQRENIKKQQTLPSASEKKYHNFSHHVQLLILFTLIGIKYELIRRPIKKNIYIRRLSP